MKPPPYVSLSDELAELELVLEASETLADLLSNGHLPDQRTIERAPLLLAAIVDLALNRVRLVRRVIRQEADPKLIAGKRNTRSATLASWEDPDILLRSRRSKSRRRLPTK